MKRYCIKCETGRVEFLDILYETEEGFMTRVVRVKDGYEKTIEEFMPHHLFELCIKTGYIYPVESAATSVA
ncbi:MAG: hypothetical protein SNJ56_06945 [Termitinemataceae bacterium]